jgi:ribosome-binding protein aMBF1 (putative translation factor)
MGEPMAKNRKLDHVNRPLSEEERQRAQSIREGARRDFPPKAVAEETPPPGIPGRIQLTRKQRGMTRYELGQTAKVPSTVVRAIEQGHDVPLSQFRAVAAALGLNIELVEQV